MSARLKRNLDFLNVLAKAKPKQRQAIISTASKDLLLCICEVVDNILRGAVKLTVKQKQQLKRYKKVLRTVADRKIPLKQKQKLISQKGGFLSAAIIPVLSIAAALLGEAVRNG